MEEFYIDSDGIRLHAKLVCVPGADHCFGDHIEEMAAAIRNFFTE